MSAALVPIPYAACFTADEAHRLRAGFVAVAMEDKWAIRSEPPSLLFHRSWTGRLIFRADLVDDGEGARIEHAWCDPAVLADGDAAYQARLLGFLIDTLLLGRAAAFPVPPGLEQPIPGLYQHAVAGTGYPEVPDRSWRRRVGTAARFAGFLVGIGGGKAAPDGFGQSLWADLCFMVRFWRCRRLAVVWDTPAWEQARADEAHPIIGRFGDDTIAEAVVDGRRWLVRERDWHGWPDPPRYCFFALEDEAIWCAADFHRWPRAWQAPPAGT